MKSLIFLQLILLTFMFNSSALASKIELITLQKGNFTAIDSEINDKIINEVITKILISKKEEPFYLYIDSPGGSVFSTFRLLEVLKQAPHVVCISNKAFSGAYIITQACHTRDVLEVSTFMWHSVQSSSSGSSENMALSALIAKKLQFVLDMFVSNRLHISLSELIMRKIPEYWTMGGEELIRTRQADNLVQVTCTPELAKELTTVRVQPNPYSAPIEIDKSACPI